MIEKVERWVNDMIHSHRQINVLYPTNKELKKMPIHHEIKAKGLVRIVHIDGVEYNPCGGLHVQNIAEVGFLAIVGTEIAKKKVRIHYLFGEVARFYFHQYYDELKKVSVKLSKPMIQSFEGVMALEKQILHLEQKYENLSNQWIHFQLEMIIRKANQYFVVDLIDLDDDLSGKLIKQL